MTNDQSPMTNYKMDFNIAIRTALVRDGMIEYWAGGGIVFDSDPEKEYEETLHKGASLFQTLGVTTETLEGKG